MYMKGEPENPPAVLNSLPLKIVVLVGALGVAYIGIFPGSLLDIALKSIVF